MASFGNRTAGSCEAGLPPHRHTKSARMISGLGDALSRIHNHAFQTEDITFPNENILQEIRLTIRTVKYPDLDISPSTTPPIRRSNASGDVCKTTTPN